jgi:hypothetical protein
LRCYAVAIAFFVALAETEWEVIFRLWQVLEYWVGRGMFQIFIATLTKVLARASGETQAESVLHDVASWWLLICGIVYTAAGLLCIGRIKRSHLREVSRRQQAIKDLEVYSLVQNCIVEGMISTSRELIWNCLIVAKSINPVTITISDSNLNLLSEG